MPNYRRINIDGKSLYKTETRTAAAATLPGTFVVINSSDQFAVASALVGRIYVADVGYHQGLGILDAIPAGDSVVGNYVEEGRELVIRVPAGTYVKDAPIKLGVSGLGALATDDEDSVIGYAQDDSIVVPVGEQDFIRVRFRVGTVAVGG